LVTDRLNGILLIRRSLLLVVVVALAQGAFAASVVSSGGGLAAATAARDSFRTALGGGLVGGAHGSFGGVRREINWDGVPTSLAAPSNLPANFFNANSPRGVVFSTPGSGFQVSANAGVTPVRFGNLNFAYSATFAAFTEQRLFTALGSTVVDVNFFVAGGTAPATVTGFGAIFSDVDNAATASIEYFDQNNASLGNFFVPPANGDVSFLGVEFNTGELVSRVRITSGNAALGPADAPPAADVVVMDDFVYSEPKELLVQVPTLSAWGMLLLGTVLAVAGTLRARSTR
jgi:hypothetical protein